MKVYNCKNKVTYLIIILFYMCFYSGFVFAQDKAKKAFERAKFEFEAENYDTALLMINKALEVDPENLEYKYYLALIYERTEKFRDAVSVFENLIKTSPEKYSKTYFQIAMIYAKLEENEQAMSYLKKAKKIDPKNASIYFNEGILFLKLMNYQEAIPLFEKAKQVDHNFSQIATFHIGLAYQRQKKYKMAKKLFKEAIEYAPETSIAKDCKQIISNIKGEKTGGRPWSIITSLSFQYDDNVYLDALEAADIRRYTGAASRDKSDFCTNFNFMGSYRLLKFNMWEAGFSYTNTQFIYNDLGDNNLIGNIGSIYTTFDRNPVWLKLHYEFSYYFATSDLEDKLRMNSIESILVLREKALFRTEIRALYQDMEFLDDTPDTYHVTIGITQFIPIKRNMSFRAGYKYEIDEPEDNAGYRCNEFLLGFSTPLFYGISMDISGTLTLSDYDSNENFSLKDKRYDKRKMVNLSFNKILTKNFRLMLIYTRTMNDSNLNETGFIYDPGEKEIFVDPYEWNKNVVAFFINYIF